MKHITMSSPSRRRRLLRSASPMAFKLSLTKTPFLKKQKEMRSKLGLWFCPSWCPGPCVCSWWLGVAWGPRGAQRQRRWLEGKFFEGLVWLLGTLEHAAWALPLCRLSAYVPGFATVWLTLRAHAWCCDGGLPSQCQNISTLPPAGIPDLTWRGPPQGADFPAPLTVLLLPCTSCLHLRRPCGRWVRVALCRDAGEVGVWGLLTL